MFLWRAAYAMTICAGINYLFWLSGALNWQLWFLAVPFFVCECCFILQLLCTIMLVYSPSKRQELHVEESALEKPLIAVIIPVCGESEESIRDTIDSALAIRYPSDRIKVFVTDDKRDDNVRALTQECGVICHTHPAHGEAKAGNLNRLLPDIVRTCTPEWLLVIDTGDTVHPDIISRCTPHFTEKGIAFIQVERRFNDEQNGLPSDTRYFYNVMLPRRDRCNTMFACGSGTFWKIETLMELGGFSTWNIVEDLTTSYELQNKGWHGRYVAEPLHMGTAAPDIRGLLRQRYQWACDSLRLLYWRNPLLKRGSSIVMRMAYADTALYYLFTFPMITIRSMPVVIVWSGFSLFNTEAGGWVYWMYFLPLFCARLLCDFIECRLHGTRFRHWWRQTCMHEGMSISLLYAKAAITTLLSGPDKKPRYHVTPKVGGTGFFPYAVQFQITLFALNMASIVYAFYARESCPWLVTLMIWLLYASALLIPFIESAAVIASQRTRRYWQGLFRVAFIAGVCIFGFELFMCFSK